MDFKVPILLIAYNRPKCIARVIESIKEVRPSKLYVACDGPNENIENNKKVYRLALLAANRTHSTHIQDDYLLLQITSSYLNYHHNNTKQTTMMHSHTSYI